jgi:uncharacterized protein (TIGR02757 family)
MEVSTVRRRQIRVRPPDGHLAARLDTLYGEFNHADAVADPVHLVRPFRAPADREIAGFCAAALAFGRVSSVIESIRALFAVMGPSPAAFVREFDPRREGPRFAPLVHRWTRGADLAALMLILQLMLRESGSIEQFFVEGDEPASPDISTALDSFSERALSTDVSAAYGRRPRRPGVCYFFPRPSAGSACKRLNLFLRWMVRRDAVDLGVWRRIPPSRLVVPLDTHVIRLGQCLRLTRYRSPGWKMAAEITASLRRLDPVDPVRYDFSLCHVGMMGNCGFHTERGDADCPLKGLCLPRGGTRTRRRSAGA